MVSQFIRMKFKNAAGAFQSFTIFGQTVSELNFTEWEIESVAITESRAQETSVTVGGFASQVVVTNGRKANFGIKFGHLQGDKTIEKLEKLYSFVNFDRWTVQLTVMQGNFNYGASGLTPATYSFDCLLNFTANWRKPYHGKGLEVTTTDFEAIETQAFALPVAADVITTAPVASGQ